MALEAGARGIAAWRWVAALGFTFVFVTTHWPRLTFGPEGPSDKFIHAMAFGVLTFFAFQARWVRHPLVLFLGMAAVAALDESTQQLALFNRHTSLADYLADVLGIAVTSFFVFSALPEPPWIADAKARLWGRPFTWVALVTSGLAGAMGGCLDALGARQFVFVDARLGQLLLLSGALGAIVFVEGSWRGALAAIRPGAVDAEGTHTATGLDSSLIALASGVALALGFALISDRAKADPNSDLLALAFSAALTAAALFPLRWLRRRLASH